MRGPIKLKPSYTCSIKQDSSILRQTKPERGRKPSRLLKRVG